jgi:hypothetical protein
MRRLKRRLTASLEWLSNNIDCFNPLQAGELSDAGIKALCEFTDTSTRRMGTNTGT